MEALLLKERPLTILPSLARLVNPEAAIILQQCHWLCAIKAENQDARTYLNGEYWCSYTHDQWQERVISWRCVRQVRRILQSLVDKNLLIAIKPGGSNVIWYRVNEAGLHEMLDRQNGSKADQVPKTQDKMSTSTRTKCPHTPGQNVHMDMDKMSTSSILKRSFKRSIKKSAASECENFEDLADRENLDLADSEPEVFESSISPAEPEKETNGIGSNQEIPAETKFSAAPPENLTKEERFSWWGKHLEDPTFLRRKLETLRWDFKFLQAFGSWLLDSEAHWSKNGYKPQSAALAVLNNAGFGEKALNHRSRLATYLCKQADQPTAAPQIASQAPKVESTNSKYAHLTDSEVTAQFLTYWQEAETGSPILRPRLKNAYEIGYAEEMHRRNPQWDGKTLAQLVEINNQLATA